MAMRPNRPASSPNTPQIGMPVNNQQDPLGGNVIMRGLQSYWQGIGDRARDMSQPIGQGIAAGGPLPDPQWSGFMQAIKEHAPGGIAPPHGHADPMPGMPNSPFSAPSTMWQGGQQSAVTGAPYRPQFSPQQAMQGLKGAR